VAVPEPVENVAVANDQPMSSTHEATEAPSRGAKLSLNSDIVDAPSIGPKTATRFHQIGVTTIRQFLDASVTDMAAQLNVSWIDESKLMDWQDQTRLVLQVPALCGYKAQLLVGIDCRTADELAACDVDSLHSAINQFCGCETGARIIRSGALPSRDEVAKWIGSAAEPGDTLRAA
jgi:predicted flap endonuclease-1-like 5' DNA nuclease